MLDKQHFFKDSKNRFGWTECFCPNPFDSHQIISYGVVPIGFRVPAKIDELREWNS